MNWKWKKRLSTLAVSGIVFGILPFGSVAVSQSNESSGLNQSLVLSSSNQQVDHEIAPSMQSVTSQVYLRGDEQRVIVTFKDRTKMNRSLIKGTIRRENKHSASISATMTTKEIEELKQQVSVLSVEPDIQLQAAAQTMDWGTAVVNATYSWNNGYTGKGVKVAVLDSGINTHHEDLAVAGGASFVDYTTSYDDDYGHGTHVAGIIGAKNNDVGIIGVAPDADLYAVKVLDSQGVGYLSSVIAGIEWAIENKADIINMSMTTRVDSAALHHAVDQAYASGLLVVAAAGNTGNAEGNGDTVQYPAKYSSVIAVGAADREQQRASFSATGSSLEIAAPGVGIRSTHLNNGYTTASGTSAAAPFVTGGLALLKQQDPTLDNIHLRNILDEHVLKSTDDGRDSIFGYGLLDLSSTSGSKINNTLDPVAIGDEQITVHEGVYAAIADKIVTYENLNDYFALSNMGVSTLLDGRVFITGGYSPSTGNQSYKETYMYNSNSGASTKVASLPTVTSGHRQTTLLDGRVLITGGSNGGYNSYYNYALIYNPTSNSYTSAANLPMSLASHAQSRLLDGRVLVCGGYSYSGVLQSACYLYDLTSNTWTWSTSLPVAMANFSQSTLLDGRVLVCGTDGKTYLYDSANNSWTESVPMPYVSTGHSQTTMPDGRVAVIGNYNNNKISIFDPSKNAWSISSITLPYNLSAHGQSLLADGRLALFGGAYLSKTYYQARALHLISLNMLPKLAIDINNQTVYPQTGDPTITIIGTAIDTDNDNLTITATIAGVTKSTVISNTSTSKPWQLTWNALTDSIPQGSYSNIVVTVNDGQSSVTATYSGTIVVDHNRAPYAPALVSPLSNDPSSAVLIPLNGSTYTWNFADPDIGDYQTANQVIFTNQATGTLEYDSGWINSGVNSFNLPANKLTAGAKYRWQVRTKDSRGAVSPYSSPSYIQLNRFPTLAITSYTDGQQMIGNVLQFTWSYLDPDGQPQKSYQVTGSKDNWATIGYDSGVINSSQASHTTAFLADGTWNFKIVVHDGMDWSNPAFRTGLKLPNDFEPNDTIAQAFPINFGQGYTSYISSSTDVDFYKYVAPATGLNRLSMTVPTGPNYDVYLYDSNSNLIASGVREAGLSENVLYEVIAGSTYYIKIVGVGGNFSATSPYSFNVNRLNMQFQTNYQYDFNGNIIGKSTVNTN